MIGLFVMKTQIYELKLKTTSAADVIDISDEVASCVGKSGVDNGLVTVTVPGSTASITTIEYEPGVIEDLKRALERLAPSNISYAHDAKWGDGNGYSHVRAALMKPSLSIPVKDGEMTLGTWQQIVLCDFDNKPRSRSVVVQILG